MTSVHGFILFIILNLSLLLSGAASAAPKDPLNELYALLARGDCAEALLKQKPRWMSRDTPAVLAKICKTKGPLKVSYSKTDAQLWKLEVNGRKLQVQIDPLVGAPTSIKMNGHAFDLLVFKDFKSTLEEVKRAIKSPAERAQFSFLFSAAHAEGSDDADWDAAAAALSLSARRGEGYCQAVDDVRRDCGGQGASDDSSISVSTDMLPESRPAQRLNQVRESLGIPECLSGSIELENFTKISGATVTCSGALGRVQRYAGPSGFRVGAPTPLARPGSTPKPKPHDPWNGIR